MAFSLLQKHPQTLVESLPHCNQLRCPSVCSVCSRHSLLCMNTAEYAARLGRLSIVKAAFGHYSRCLMFFFSKGQLEQVQLSAPSVVVKNKAVNLTTVLRPSNVGTVIFYWWFDNKTEASLIFSFPSMRPVNQMT